MNRLKKIITRKPLAQCSHRYRRFIHNLMMRNRLEHLENVRSPEQSSSDDSSSETSYLPGRHDILVDDNDIQMETDDNNIPNLNVVQQNLDNFAPHPELNNFNVGGDQFVEHLNENDEVSFETVLADTFNDSALSFTHSQCNAVLKVLRTHPCFANISADSRTIRGTPTGPAPIIPLANGEYLHLGFEKKLLSILESTPLVNIPNCLHIDVHTDGACPDKSRKINMWPIQIRICNIPDSKPTMVGIFKGKKKPSDAEAFFKPFIDEVLIVIENGGFKFRDKVIPFLLRCTIADEPARAFTLGHKEHGATSPCSRCWVTGTWLRRGVMVYLGPNHPPRTEEQYGARTDGEHFLEGPCPIDRLPIQKVSQVVFEYMHLVCLGVMEKVFQATIDGKYSNSSKMPPGHVAILNSRLEQVKLFCPSDFSRQPVNSEKHGSFKATEQRQILLYSGPAIFLGLFNDAVYTHFLLLHSAMKILVDPLATEELIADAEESLELFVKHADKVFGAEFVSYNVHGLVHLGEDVRMFGPLDEYSAFPYESHMIYLQKMCKKKSKQLEQIYRREVEMSNLHKKPVINVMKPLGPHSEGPLTEQFQNCSQFSKLKYGKKWCISIFQKDNTFILKNSRICVVQNIVRQDGNYYLIVKYFTKKEDFYVSLISSSSCGVYHCSRLSNELDAVQLNDIEAKCFRMSYWLEMATRVCIPDEYVVVKISSYHMRSN